MSRYDMERRMMARDMARSGRNPYGSEGGYVTSSRRSRRGRRDRGMDYEYDRRDYRGGDYEYDSRRNDRAYSQYQDERGRRDYESSGQSDMGYNYNDMRNRGRGRDGHYPMEQGSTYYPIEAMGTFSGYWGQPQEDYRGGRDMNYRDYRYDRNSDYGDYGDYGEKLTKEELEEWKHKLLKEVDEKDKHFFTKEQIGQKARQMGLEMKDYNEEELVVATAMVYTDYCKTGKKYVGNNMDFYVEIARDWLEDKDSELKGGEKLAVYHDCVIMGD